MAGPVPDAQGPQTEFFHPFVHVPGRFEWCRIMAPSHGVFDCFIVFGESTAVPALVYVNSDVGAAFLQDRYPECRAMRVAAGDLKIVASAGGRVVEATLRSEAGPVRGAQMRFEASQTALPRDVPYGGQGEPTWGSRWTCTGVDLELDAKVIGEVHLAEGGPVPLDGAPGILTLGSYGHLVLRETAPA